MYDCSWYLTDSFSVPHCLPLSQIFFFPSLRKIEEGRKWAWLALIQPSCVSACSSSMFLLFSSPPAPCFCPAVFAYHDIIFPRMSAPSSPSSTPFPQCRREETVNGLVHIRMIFTQSFTLYLPPPAKWREDLVFGILDSTVTLCIYDTGQILWYDQNTVIHRERQKERYT